MTMSSKLLLFYLLLLQIWPILAKFVKIYAWIFTTWILILSTAWPKKHRQENGNWMETDKNWYIAADYLEMLQDDTAGHSFEDNEPTLLPDLQFTTTTYILSNVSIMKGGFLLLPLLGSIYKDDSSKWSGLP